MVFINYTAKIFYIIMPFFAAAFYCLILLFPEIAAKGVSDSLMLCTNVLIPSIYPFTVASNILFACNFGQRLSKAIKKLFENLFHISSTLIFPCILGIFSGYPQGTLGVLSVYEMKECSKEEAEHALCLCNNTGVAFIFGALSAMLGNVRFAFKLFLIQLFSTFVFALIFRPRVKPEPQKYNENTKKIEPATLFSSAAKAIYPMTIVCANVIFFGVISELIKSCSSTLSLPRYVTAFMLSAIEISNATSYICSSHPIFLHSLLAFAVTFSGICVHLQLFCCIKGRLSMKKFFFSKFFQGLLAFLIMLFCESY